MSYISSNKILISPAYTFRKEGHTKIIEYDLTPKQKAANAVAGRRRPDIFLYNKSSKGTSSNAQAGNDSGEGATSEEEGEDVMSEEEDEDANPTSTIGGDLLARAANGKVKGKRGRNERVVAPEECRAHLRRLFQNDNDICALLYGRHGPFALLNSKGLSVVSADMFFMEVLPVSPTRFRPPAKMGETLFEHPQNELLTKVLHTCYRLRDLNQELRAASTKDAIKEDQGTTRIRVLGSLLESLVQLQVDVNSFIDSSKNPTVMRQGKLPPAGVKQGLEKKEGLFRMHMMVRLSFYFLRLLIHRSSRVNVSIMLPALSFLQMLISSQTRLESRQSLPES